MNKRHLPCLAMAATFAACGAVSENNEESRLPNIIYILADDLGIGDIGYFGQEFIHTPNLDRLAANGMIFTQHYSGSTVCAPARSSLLTGQHTGHTYIRGNHEIMPEGQMPISDERITLGQMMQNAGYVTGAFGKWGLGMPGTTGDPNHHGFDLFFGYMCQRQAHRYYPEYIWENDQKYFLEGNDLVHTVTYSQDVIQARTLDFIRENKDKPFFAYVPHLIPHAELNAPDDSILDMYYGRFPEAPWGFDNTTGDPHLGNDYGDPDFDIRGYAPVKNPRAVFAAMVTRLDLHVGQIMQLLDELGLADNTLIIFTSDNGPHKEGGADPEFFNSSAGFRGTKRDLYEGGIRVPMIAYWPGRIAAGTRTDHISAFWDVMPTFAGIARTTSPDDIDGISFLPTLLGQEGQQEHEYLYWEFHEWGGRQAVRKGDWKLVKLNVLRPDIATYELYDLSKDPFERNEISGEYPEVVAELKHIMTNSRVPSEKFPFIERFNNN
jgi:arylsulfatase A-like enzyme